ncbi:MAG: polysaccharide deacetylase family protein [Bacteroidota bacterium]
MKSEVLIYAPKLTNRLRFAADFIFESILGVTANYTDKKEDALATSLPLIVYGDPFEKGISIPSAGIINETGVHKLEPVHSKWDDTDIFFPVHGETDLPFDLFGAAFYLLSRYEEYNEIKRDIHGRPIATNTLMGRNQILHLPLIDQWALKLASFIQKKYPEWNFAERKYQYIPTIDVDNAWMYLNKGSFRTWGAMLKLLVKGKFGEIKKRIRVLQQKEQDPYNVYNTLFAIHNGANLRAKYFFLFAGYSKYDKGCNIHNIAFRRLIARVNDYAEIGIHPSYYTIENKKRMHEEVRRMSNFLEEPVTSSRQHFLRLKLPETYTELVNCRIRNDFSMGFADSIGFRTGTCTPHLFYDLEIETPVNIKIFPLAIMDTTLNRYMHLSPDEAKSEALKIYTEVKKVNGTLVTLWHNESMGGVNEWAGWENIYADLVRIFAV